MRAGGWVNRSQARAAPYAVEMRGESLRVKGRTGWGRGRIKNQLRIVPVKVAERARAIMGGVKFGSSSWVL